MFSTRMIFIALSIIGISLVPFLPIHLLPQQESPSISVQFQWKNATPRSVERYITTPLEGSFSLLENLKKISSRSNNGKGSIELTFDKNIDIQQARTSVATKIRQLFPQLPKGMTYPAISIKNPATESLETPLLTFTVTADLPVNDLFRYTSERIQPQLALIAGIQKIEVSGGNFLSYQILFDEAKIQTLNWTKARLEKAISEALLVENLGFGLNENQLLPVTLKSAAITSPSDFLDLPVGKVNQRIILLREVATVALSEISQDQVFRINGQNTVRLLFFPTKAANTLTLAKAVKAKIHQLNLPAGYQIVQEQDATEFLEAELNKVISRSLASLLFLVVFIGLIYRNWRLILVILSALTVNLALAFIGYYAAGVQLHLYALAGITVSFGLMLDNIVVMMDNWLKRSQHKVFTALLGATLTSIATLLLLNFLPEKWQVSLLDFALVIGINLVVSLVVAYSFVPALLSFFSSLLKKEKKQNFGLKRKKILLESLYSRILNQLFRFRKGVMILMLLLFGIPTFLLPPSISELGIYNKTIGQPWFFEKVKPTLDRILGGTFRLFSKYVYEKAVYNEPEATKLYLQINLPTEATSEQLNKVLTTTETYLKQYNSAIKQFITVANDRFGQIEIQFTPEFERYFPYQLRNQMIQYSLNFSGVEWRVLGVGQAFSNANSKQAVPYRAVLYGYNFEELEKQAVFFSKKLAAHPRVESVNIEGQINWWEKDLYEYILSPNYRSIAASNLQLTDFQQIISGFDQNFTPTLSTSEGIPIEIKTASVKDKWTLENVPQEQEKGKVLFSNYFSLQKSKVNPTIHKENQEYLRLVEWNYLGTPKFGVAHRDDCMKETRLAMPLGYRIQPVEREDKKDGQQQAVLLFWAIALIFGISAVLFESLRQAFIVILLIPTSFIGIFLTFYLFDFHFDQGGYAAFLLISGLSVNAILLIINEFNQIQKSKSYLPFEKKYRLALRYKFTPILLSVFTTIFGLLPFVLGGVEVFWFSLAVGTIGGLTFSLVMVLFFLPLFFSK